MARLFDDASSQYGEYAGAVVTAAPLTMACWANVDAAVDQVLMSLGNNGAEDRYFVMRARGDAAGVIQAALDDGGGLAQATSSAGFSLNTWFHAAVVFTSATARAAYFNGGNSGTDTTNRTPTGLNRTGVGRLTKGTPTLYTSGMLAEAAIWSVALSADEIAALANGFCPLLIRPAALVAYWPLLGAASPEPDRWNGRFDLTLGASPAKADHPRVLMPAGVAA